MFGREFRPPVFCVFNAANLGGGEYLMARANLVQDPVQQRLLKALIKYNISSIRLIVESGFRFDLKPQVLSEVYLGKPVPNNHNLSTSDLFRSIYLEYVASGNVDVTKLMLEARIDMDCKNRYGEGPLQLATKICDRDTRWEMVEVLMAAGVMPLNEDEKYTSCSIIEATKVGDMDLIRVFINAGAELNCLDHDGQRSILHVAVSRAIKDKSQLELISKLFDLGANVKVTTKNGSNLLHHAIKLHNANRYTHTYELVMLLLDLGVDLNVIDHENVSPLALAVTTDQYALVEKMIEAGALINLSNQCTGSPLQLAVTGNNCAIVKLLLDKGANPMVRDRCGNNILHYAAGYSRELQTYQSFYRNNVTNMPYFTPHPRRARDNLEIIKMIVAQGVPIQIPEYGECRPFTTALSSYNFGAVQFFLENENESLTSDVQYLLHKVAPCQNQELMKYLLNKRLYDVDEMNESGLTPLFIAAGHRCCNSVIELIKSGANVNIFCEEKDLNAHYSRHTNETHQRSPLSKAIIPGPLMLLSNMDFDSSRYDLNDFKLVDALLTAGANIDTPDVYQAYKILIGFNEDHFRHFEERNPAIVGTHLNNSVKALNTWFINPLIRQIALLKSQDYPIVSGYEKYLSEKLPRHYFELMEQCSNELEVMKTSILYDTVTLYDLLVGKDITLFVNNEQVAATLKLSKISKQFRSYRFRLNLCFLFAKARRDLMDGAIEVLSKLLQSRFDNAPLILYNVITKLGTKDLITLGSMRR
ncbi:hypothetical protein QAD02_004817 [Eretmocerus hayati]|uniref:Uncharacterized protein n=1 Tax=Eretmocerus hayati TaxID=131215 RepID=A0ACC2NQL6_9HYME|nr:hypothetical protein QAD02_004817 [Eretmocerus hayati]